MLRVPFLSLFVVLALPVAANSPALAETALSGDYDCTSVEAAPPARSNLQWRDGGLVSWREWVDPAGAIRCIELSAPPTGFLDRDAARGWLDQGQARPARRSQSLPSDQPPADIPPVRLPRPEDGAAPLSEPGALAPPVGVGPESRKDRPEPAKARDENVPLNHRMMGWHGDDRERVSDASISPFASTGMIVTRWPRGPSSACSAHLVTPFVALTAGHCVHDSADGGFADSISLYVQQNQFVEGGPIGRPFAALVAQSFQTTQRWTEISGEDSYPTLDFRHDMAALFFNDGFAGIEVFPAISFSHAAQTAGINVGYPYEVQDIVGNDGMWWAEGSALETVEGLREWDITGSSGNSGGPYLTAGPGGATVRQFGILSYGAPEEGLSGGPFFDDWNQQLISEWAAWTPAGGMAEGPANDDFADASVLSGTKGTVVGSNRDAGSEVGEPALDPFAGGASVWWRWTAPHAGSMTIDSFGSSFDTLLGVYEGAAPDRLTLIASNDDAEGSLQSKIRFDAAAGQSYAIMLDGWLDETGEITLSWSFEAMTPQTGWWWDADRPGQGFSIERQGERLFLAGYLYRQDGSPRWMIALGDMPEPMGFSGSLDRYCDGQTLGGGWREARLEASIGSVSLDFVSEKKATLSWPGGTAALERFDIVAGGCDRGPRFAEAPEAGWWWHADEPGRGFFLEVQDETLFISGYMYDAEGDAEWYVSLGEMAHARLYDGRWTAYRDGPTFEGPGSPTADRDIGAVSLRFSSRTDGVMSLPNGAEIPLERFRF